MRKAILIHNPTAGVTKRARLIDEICSILKDGGVEVDKAPTEEPGHATEIARKAAAGGDVDSILVFGGDGTLREAATGLLGTPVGLAPLSGGTTNVVARGLGLPIEPRKAARRLLDGELITADVGLCNDQPFLILASFGIDAAIMRDVSSRLKNLTGRGAVIATGLRSLWDYDYPETSYLADGEPGSGTFVAACNIAEYGGDFRLAPAASFVDHKLHLVTFRGHGRFGIVGFAALLVLGSQHVRLRKVTTQVFEELVVPGPEIAPLQLDGDFVEIEPPIRIRRSEQSVFLIKPRPRR